MLRTWLLGLASLAAIVVGAFWLLTRPQTIAAETLGAHTPDVANGRAMFFAGGCASCHATPNQDDATRLGGGLALHSPFGTFYAPNVSPHRTDGIGAWTEAQFVTAMTKGTSPAGEHYYPAFPYTSYQRMRTRDIRDLFAFMRTLPEVEGRIRGHDLPFPFNVRRGLGLWKYANLDGETFRPSPQQSEEWNRGAYLVNGPAHCAECHSPRDFMGGIQTASRFAGGPNPEGKGWVPNITQERLKDWSVGDIEEVLSSGITPEGDVVGANMLPVVRNIAQLSAEDRRAMAVYIKSLPPLPSPPRPER
jgi:mono/diheme cytochrome c family protein